MDVGDNSFAITINYLLIANKLTLQFNKQNLLI